MSPLLLSFLVLGGLLVSSGYAGEVEQWREKREAKLKAEDGWLTLIGLFWLKDGDNRVGADPSAEISLPKGRAPGKVATLVLREGKVYLKPAPGVKLLVNGKAPTDQPLKSDRGNQDPDQVTTGDFRFFVIWRSDKLAIRLKDKNSPYRIGFTGLKWYPPLEQYRLTAKLVPYPKPK